jgi:hypothetical protein
VIFHEENKKRREEIQRKKSDTDKNITGKPATKSYKNEKSDKIIWKKFDRELKEAE